MAGKTLLGLLAFLFVFFSPFTHTTASRKPAQEVTPTAVTIQLSPVLTGLTSPLYVTHAGDGSNRLFIVEQAGIIKVLQPGASSPTVFLNITSRVLSGGERGLLGLAFHPEYATNGRFFVNYTRQTDGATVIAAYRVSAANPDIASTAETVLLTIAQPFANHNGGVIAFGQDGYLYIGSGDGGSANDPGNRAQNINDLLGKILRIDVDTPNGSVPYSSPPTNPYFGATPGADEIYAIGMRNPFRFSFDRGGTNQLYVGDVGQGAREEIDIVTLGGNYGWRIMEGSICNPNFSGGVCTPPTGHIPPITEYAHTGGRCSVTGGNVYRGPIATMPTGVYLFADFCTGEIFSLENGVQSVAIDTSINIASFGEDEVGELYVVGLGGTLDRIVNPNAPCVFAINPTAKTVLGNNNTGNVVVTTPAGCTWTAVSNAPFITITSGGGGVGRGVVNFSVALNTTGATRTGTLTVAGQTVTITQTADGDNDSIPDVVELQEGTNPFVKDNDIFATARLFAMQQFRDVLSREGNAGGITFWSNAILSGTLTRAQVIEQFFNSAEYQNITPPVIRLYLASFLRRPAYGGLQFWTMHRRQGVPLAQIAESFAQSAEFISRYGSLNNSDYVTQVYLNVLGRPPLPEGLAFWTGHLNTGAMTRGQVMLAFSESAEFRGRIANAVFVVQLYSSLLRRVPTQAEFDAAIATLASGGTPLTLLQSFLNLTEYHDRFLPAA